MPKLRKTLKLDDTEITVLELTVDQIIELGQLVTGQAAPDAEDAEGAADGPDIPDLFTLAGVSNLLESHLDWAVQGIKMNDLRKKAPSELKEIYTAFREVNTLFFEVAQQVGLEDLLRTLKETVQKDFSNLLASL